MSPAKVSRPGSSVAAAFSAASRLTGTPKPTLSRRVAQLERQVGQFLVERGRSGTRLTAEGQALFERSRPLLAALTDMPLRKATPSGVLRISVPTLLAHAGFGRFASSYYARHPAVRLDVVAEDRIVDPVREGYDLVVRAEVLPGITTIPLPGHTPGHTGYRLDGGSRSLLVWGDIVHLPQVQAPEPEAGVVFDVDGAMAVQTRRRMLDEAATDRLLVAGMHTEFPGLANVIREGAGYCIVPELWVTLQP